MHNNNKKIYFRCAVIIFSKERLFYARVSTFTKQPVSTRNKA